MTMLYRSARAESPHLGRLSFWTTCLANAEWFAAWEARVLPGPGPSRIYQADVAMSDGEALDLCKWPGVITPEWVIERASALTENRIAWVWIMEGGRGPMVGGGDLPGRCSDTRASDHTRIPARRPCGRPGGMSRADRPDRRATIAYHRTTPERAEAILSDGFVDAEGTYMTDRTWRGVWVTYERPWDEVVAETGDALLLIDLPEPVFIEYEWAEEGGGRGYREALVPANILNRYAVRLGWECVGCDAIDDAGALGWRREVVRAGQPSEVTLLACPDCADAT